MREVAALMDTIDICFLKGVAASSSQIDIPFSKEEAKLLNNFLLREAAAL